MTSITSSGMLSQEADLNPEDVKRFRLKEVWFFDEETSTLQVRILGIAPLITCNLGHLLVTSVSSLCISSVNS